MSRSALWRQEGNVKERQRQAEQLFSRAVEEGRQNRAKNLVPMWGPDDSFHFNPMLLENTIKSSYFQKCCQDVNDWNTLVDQIYYDVKHVEPWAQGTNREPSAAFCLLLRLLTLRCTEKQMKLLLDHPDSPYIRAIGFLYLRYAGDPKVVYNWIAPYLYDEETIDASANASKQAGQSETIGEYVRRLFSDKNYHGTILPRLPIQIEREIQVKMLQAEKNEERAKKHMANSRSMDVFKKVGSKVMALYGDEENPIQWYEATVDRVILTEPETSRVLRFPKFVVTFPEYGNTETVALGQMELIGMTTDPQAAPQRGGFSRERDYDRAGFRGHRGEQPRSSDHQGRNRGYDKGSDRGYNGKRGRGGYDDREDRRRYGDRDFDDSRRHNRDRWESAPREPRGHLSLPNEDDLYEEVRRRERASVESRGRNPVASRPQGTKSRLSETSYDDHRRHGSGERTGARTAYNPAAGEAQRQPSSTSAPPPRKRTAEEMAAIQEKKRKLMARYG